MIWLIYSYQSHGVLRNYLKSDYKTAVKDSEKYFLFQPKQAYNKVFIFYPGALVDPKAYIPLCRKNFKKCYKSLLD